MNVRMNVHVNVPAGCVRGRTLTIDRGFTWAIKIAESRGIPPSDLGVLHGVLYSTSKISLFDLFRLGRGYSCTRPYDVHKIGIDICVEIYGPAHLRFSNSRWWANYRRQQ